MLELKKLTRIFVIVAIVLVSLTWTREAAAALKVASWDIQIFGPIKAKNADVMKVIVTTLKQYDLVLVQEIKDSNEATTTTLLN